MGRVFPSAVLKVDWPCDVSLGESGGVISGLPVWMGRGRGEPVALAHLRSGKRKVRATGSHSLCGPRTDVDGSNGPRAKP